ncbi:MAG: hypothetical protein KGN02_05865 [bacterium]|nr:hypothetical protein [bacterium]
MSPSSRISIALAAALLLLPTAALARRHAPPTPTPSVAPTPTLPPENPTITRLALREFVAWQADAVDPSHYAAITRAKLVPDKVAATSKQLGPYGALKSVEWIGNFGIEGGPPGVIGYIYRMHCANAAIYEEITVAPDGKIDGIIFRDTLQQ